MIILWLQRCAPDADCYKGRCGCRDGFSGDGYSCTHICGHDEVWENGRCVPLFVEQELSPNCDYQNDCKCPEGYELSEDQFICHYVGTYDPQTKNEDLIPCDVDANCHINAKCSWYEQELRHICICNHGFSGDGYNCDLDEEDSCAIVSTKAKYRHGAEPNPYVLCSLLPLQKPEICDVHATCNYNEQLGKSVCDCVRGYNGDGHHCQLAPECETAAHCGDNAFCDSGVCQCLEGFERDLTSDQCVPSGRCGSVFCGSNAICRSDVQQAVQYCDCIDGYQGDALVGCVSIPIPCNVRNNCGIHANCVPSE